MKITVKVRAAVVMLLGLSIGGCAAMSARGASSPELVTVAEKEALGYERPEGVPNPGVQRKAVENRDQIFSVVKPHVEGVLGREVELVGIDARYPYNSVNVIYRTTSEPVVASYVFVGLDKEGRLPSAASIALIEPLERANRTALGLYRMAYRDEIKKMSEFLGSTFPQYTGRPEGFARRAQMVSPDLTVNFHVPETADYGSKRKAQDEIFAAYQERPSRTDAEWREMFEERSEGVYYHLAATLVLKDPKVVPTEAMAREVGDSNRSSSLFDRFESVTVVIAGGLMMRDVEKFHEDFSVTGRAPSSSWRVMHLIDGYTQ